MTTAEKLQLLRALEEREASHRHTSNWVAWGSVLVAAMVLGTMILAARSELTQVERRVSSARADLVEAQKELANTNDDLAKARSANTEALKSLQNVEGRGGGAYAIESAVDNLLSASSANPAPPLSGGPSDASERAQLIEQLFDTNAALRVKAYGGLIPRFKDDPSLVPEIIKVAQQHPQNANGIYNSLVVLSHMNAASLKPHGKEIVAFAESSQHIGPRVSERARTLIGRVPK